MLTRRTGAVIVLAAVLAALGPAAAAPAQPAVSANPLAVTVDAAPQSVPVHGELSYSVTVANGGAERMTRVLLSVSVPPGRAELQAAKPMWQGVCEVRGNKIKVVCRLGVLQPGARVTVTVNGVAKLGGDLTALFALGAGDGGLTVPLQAVEARTTVMESTAPIGLAMTGEDLARPFQPERLLRLSWTGSDADSGVAAYDVRVRSARFGSARFGGYRTWVRTPEKRGKFTGTPGSTYCFSVRATDRLGNASAWSADSCTSFPLGVQKLRPDRLWETRRSRGYYTSHYIVSETRGASVVVHNVATRRITLIATPCDSCGAVDVLWRGRLLKRVSLRAIEGEKNTLLQVARFRSLQRGKLVVRVATTDLRVKLEGIGLSPV